MGGFDCQQDTSSWQVVARTLHVRARFAVRAVSKYNRCQRKFAGSSLMSNLTKLTRAFAALAVAAILISRIADGAERPAPCGITIIEKGSGWPVPMVELRTIHQVRFVSDNAGRIAFDLP